MTSRPRSLSEARRRLHEHPDHRRYLLITCLIGMFSTSFPATILAVSVKRIATDLGTSASTASWATTAPMLASAVAMPILGRVGDLRGHRRVFMWGFAVSIVFAVLTSLSWDTGSLIAFRTISQLAGTATIPSSLAILFMAYGPEGRVKVSGWGSSVLASAAVSGLVIGGPLIDLYGWRLIFILQGSLALVAMIGAAFVMRPGDETLVSGAIDWPGAAALAVTAFSIIFAVNRLPIWGPTPLVVGLLVTFPIALAAFLRIERRAVIPILPLSLFEERSIRLPVIANFLVCAAWSGSFLITPLLMQSVLGLSISQASLASFPRATFITLAGPVAIRLGYRWGERPVALVGLVSLGGTMFLLGVAASVQSIAIVVVAISLGGWSLGHVNTALMSTLTGAVEPSDLGLATSLQQTSTQIGAVFGSGLLSAIAADATTTPRFVLSYVLAGGACLMGAVVMKFTRPQRAGDRPRRPDRADDRRASTIGA